MDTKEKEKEMKEWNPFVENLTQLLRPVLHVNHVFQGQFFRSSSLSSEPVSFLRLAGFYPFGYGPRSLKKIHVHFHDPSLTVIIYDSGHITVRLFLFC